MHPLNFPDCHLNRGIVGDIIGARSGLVPLLAFAFGILVGGGLALLSRGGCVLDGGVDVVVDALLDPLLDEDDNDDNGQEGHDGDGGYERGQESRDILRLYVVGRSEGRHYADGILVE